MGDLHRILISADVEIQGLIDFESEMPFITLLFSYHETNKKWLYQKRNYGEI